MSKKLIVTLSAVLLFVAAACQKAEENRDTCKLPWHNVT